MYAFQSSQWRSLKSIIFFLVRFQFLTPTIWDAETRHLIHFNGRFREPYSCHYQSDGEVNKPLLNVGQYLHDYMKNIPEGSYVLKLPVAVYGCKTWSHIDGGTQIEGV
jgi:hypothetical protein